MNLKDKYNLGINRSIPLFRSKTKIRMNKLKEINGNYYQECEVLMLATNDTDLTKRHLYFISNEEIKEGDWFMSIFNGYPLHNVKGGFVEYPDVKGCKKIIATTDLSLEIKYNGLKSILENWGKKLPQPSKSFIQAYTKAYNEGKPITKVLVEMEEYATKTTYYSDIDCSIPLFRLKVNSSNEINIKKIKDSYTREEIIALFEKARVDIMDMTFDGDFPECYVSKEELFEWIEENL